MNDKIQHILEHVRYCTLSTVDGAGQPWAAPVWYVYDEDHNIYWWSPTTSQHSQNLANNHSAYITIFDSTAPEGDGLGAYIRATASEVDPAELEKAIKLYNVTTTKFKLSVENCSGNAPTRIYKATPANWWLNDGIEQDGFWQDTRIAS